jgi:hypothetical protein
MNDIYFNLINIIFAINNNANNDETEAYCQKKYNEDDVNFLYRTHDNLKNSDNSFEKFQKLSQKIDSFTSLCKSFRE